MSAFSAEDLRLISETSVSASPANTAGDKAQLAELAETIRGHAGQRRYSGVVIAGLVRLVELALIFIVSIAIFSIYVDDNEDALRYVSATALIVAFAGAALQSLGCYTRAALRAPLGQGLRIAGGWALVFLAIMALDFLFRLDGLFSRVWVVSLFFAGLVVFTITRMAAAIVMRRLTRAGMIEQRAVIVGGGAAGEKFLRDVMRQTDSDLRIYGVFDDREDDRSPDVLAGFPKLGNVDDLVEFSRSVRLDLIIFTLPIAAETRILQMLRKLWVLPVDIRLASNTNQLRFRPRAYSYVSGVPVIDVFDKPIADWGVIIKMVFDRIVGAIALVMLSPVLLATAIAIKLDSRGPVFFRQRRYGFNNELVEVYKFRSMYADNLDHTASKLVTKDDPRVTRVGRFIRKTSIDELPQLINVVFKGDLSLVGPRPHAVHAKADNQQYEQVVDGYFARHKMRPGITGWAQVNGWRGETDTQEKIQRRVECDLYYIENWSIIFDIYILAITPLALTKSENAY
ncbi:MAG: undecaprenyl-phosphate glucose phosphotransferase [Beijerinckiaceae bacterium]|nr:undecaprenyl-phosphate glucose phosphotransferase [Beijerinckiaceae bacterium]